MSKSEPRITFFHKQYIILFQRGRHFSLHRLAALREPYIMLFNSFVTPLDETIFSFVINTVLISIYRRHFNNGLKLWSSMTFLVPSIANRFLAHRTLRGVAALLDIFASRDFQFFRPLLRLFHHHQMKVLSLLSKFENYFARPMFVYFLRLVEDYCCINFIIFIFSTYFFYIFLNTPLSFQFLE